MRKKQGLPARATFFPLTSTDTDYESTGVIELRKQNEQKCITKKLKLQVQQAQNQGVPRACGWAELLSIF